MPSAIDGDRTPGLHTGTRTVSTMSESTSTILALLDGTIVPIEAPIVRADDAGVVRGDGVFDATLVVRGEIRELDDHLERLRTSARILLLPDPDDDGYRRALAALVEAWDWDAAPEAVARLVLTRGPESGGAPNAWVTLSGLSSTTIAERDTGVRVLVLDRGFDGAEVADLPWLLPGAKSLSYGINMAAKRYAATQGADDALFVSSNGELLEGPTSTLLVDVDGTLVTPPQDGILASITLVQLQRRAPAEGLEVQFRPLRVEDLRAARGAWLISSGRLAAPIVQLDGAPMPVSPLDAAIKRALDVPGA